MEAPTRAGTAEVTGKMLDGRYSVFGEIGCGGMATVHYGRLNGIHGFSRPVAIKRLHPHLCRDPDFVAMFADEARLSACLAHANIVPTLDVVQTDHELAIVMEYVHGEPLSALLSLLLNRSERIPTRIAVTIVASTLHALEAAHNARNERGEPLMIVHRDVSPQNILLGADGVPRLLDFGIAKAAGRLRLTPGGELKGKLNYIAPEQLRGEPVSSATDIYGAAVVLWELLTGFPLFDGPNEASILKQVFEGSLRPPSSENREVPAVLDRIVMRGLCSAPDERFPSARHMADELEREIGVVSQSELADWLHKYVGEQLAARRQALQQQLEGEDAAAERRASDQQLRSSARMRVDGTDAGAATERSGEGSSTRRLDHDPPAEPTGSNGENPTTHDDATADLNVHGPTEPALVHAGATAGKPPRPRTARRLVLAATAVACAALAFQWVNSPASNPPSDTHQQLLQDRPRATTHAATPTVVLGAEPPASGEAPPTVSPTTTPLAPAGAIDQAVQATTSDRIHDGEHEHGGSPTQGANIAQPLLKEAEPLSKEAGPLSKEAEPPPKAEAERPRSKLRRARAARRLKKKRARLAASRPDKPTAAAPIERAKDDSARAPHSGGPAQPDNEEQHCVPIYEGKIKTYRCD